MILKIDDKNCDYRKRFLETMKIINLSQLLPKLLLVSSSISLVTGASSAVQETRVTRPTKEDIRSNLGRSRPKFILSKRIILTSLLLLPSSTFVSGFTPTSNDKFTLRASTLWRYSLTNENPKCRRHPCRCNSYSHKSHLRESNFHQDSNTELNVTQRKDVRSSILSLAIPALITLAIDPLMSLTDTILVGRYTDIDTDTTGQLITSSIPLASIGAATALLTFTFYLFNFLSTVVTPLVSQQRASGETSKALQTSSQALSLAILLGIILCITLQFIATPILHSIFNTDISMGSVGDSYAQTFVKIRALASPAIFITSAATGILRGYALDGKTSLVTVGIANVFNFLFDLVLIPSYDVSIYTFTLHWGFGLGPTGAAISTTTVEWVSALAFLGVLGGVLPSADTPDRNRHDKNPTIPLLGSNQVVHYHDRMFTKKTSIWPSLDIPLWKDVQPLIVGSSSVFARSLVLQIILAGAAAMAARSGLTIDESLLSSSSTINSISSSSASIAAHQIALQLWFLCSFVCDALAAASQTLVSDAIGRQDSSDTRDISKQVFTYSIMLGLVLGLMLQLLSFQGVSDPSSDPKGFLITFFTQDRLTQEALIPILGIVSAAQPLNSFVFAADGVLQGASEFRYQAVSMALSVAIAIVTFIGLEYGNHGATLIHVWYGLVILQIMRGITSLYKILDKKGPIDLFGP